MSVRIFQKQEDDVYEMKWDSSSELKLKLHKVSTRWRQVHPSVGANTDYCLLTSPARYLL